MTIELTDEQAEDLAIWIEMGVFETIRSDQNINNLDWVENWIRIIKKLEGE